MKSQATIFKSIAILAAVAVIPVLTCGRLSAQSPTPETNYEWNSYSIPYGNALITGNRLNNLIVSTSDTAAFGEVNELHKYDPVFDAFVAKTSFSDFQFSVEHEDGYQLAMFRTWAAAHDNVIYVSDQGRGAANNPSSWWASFDGAQWHWSEHGHTRRSTAPWTDGQVAFKPMNGHSRFGRWYGSDPEDHSPVVTGPWGNVNMQSGGVDGHGEHIYMLTAGDAGQGVIGYSDDHGQSWESIGYGPLGEGETYTNIQVDGADTFWITSGYSLWRTTDGGDTWQDFSIPEQHLLQDGEGNYQTIGDFIAFDVDNIWYAGAGGMGLHYGGGDQWTNFSNAAGFGSESIGHMTMTEDGRIWFSGNQGGIYAAIPEPSTLLLLGLSGLLLLKRRQF